MSATRRWVTSISVLVLLGAAGCGGAAAPPTVRISSGGPAPEPAASAAPVAVAPGGTKGDVAREERPREQPGLGTEWGETRRSEISMVSFERESPTRPFAAASVLYDDDAGARRLAGGAWPVSHEMFDVAGKALKVGLRDETGRLFPGFVSGDKDVVVGEAGHRYTILLHNNTDRRLELVLSVDGLDVLDGKPSSFGKRGYILDPHGDLEVEGFRQSLDAVAAFRFGSVRGSYAGQKHGDTRNVGVIGLAVFHEKGTMAFPWTAEEVRRRREANPFPGELAAPSVP